MEIKLNSNYWDCECEENFIHPRTQRKCTACEEHEEDMPDSRENEIKYLLNK